MREPAKASYREFEDRPDLEFDYFLARELRMTVGQMRQTVTGEEYLGWSTFYKRKHQREELARLRAG